MQSDGSADFDRVMRNLRRKTASLPDLLGAEILVSIRDGSPITGAPGQPVVSGELRKSFKKTRSRNLIRVFSTLFYAHFIEEGVRERHHRQGLFHWTSNRKVIGQRSTVGGFHSVKLTRVGLQKLLDHLVKQLEKVGA